MARVLIVDDSPFIRATLQKIVQDAGHQVVGAAGNGRDALKLYGELKPEVVTLDIVMESYEPDPTKDLPEPVLDGLIALEKIRALDPNARVVMVTSLTDDKVKAKSEALGARGFIVKPFKAENVRAALTQALA